MARTTAERQKAYEERRQAEGLKRVSVWVPKDKVTQLKQYALRLQKS
jgi:hypothetical protein